jgi:heptaprenyl diphosphate synthase
MLYLEQRATSDADAAELLGRLHLGTQGEATEEQFHQAIQDLREQDVTAATMAKARDMADDAIAELSAVPAGIVRDALTRFAHQIVERSY